MHRALLAFSLTLAVCFCPASVFAKRSPPAEVAAVRHGQLEYRVRHQIGNGYLPGFVEAWDPAKKGLVWIRQIYTIRRNLDLEEDVQDVFITSLKLIADRNVLEITNEAGGLFELHLETLDVKTVKGKAVIPPK